jgi:hypothetical protein
MDGLTQTHLQRRNGGIFMANEKKKKMEFSKKILIFVGIINVVVIGFSIALMWRTMDTTPLAYLIPSIAAEVSISTNAYYSKARRENILKIMQSNNVPIDENTIHTLIQ